jgi:hypothetical protein
MRIEACQMGQRVACVFARVQGTRRVEEELAQIFERALWGVRNVVQEFLEGSTSETGRLGSVGHAWHLRLEKRGPWRVPQEASDEVEIEGARDRFAKEHRTGRKDDALLCGKRGRRKMMPCGMGNHVGRNVLVHEDIFALIRAPKRQVEEKRTIPPATIRLGQNTETILRTSEGLFEHGVDLHVPKRTLVVDDERIDCPLLERKAPSHADSFHLCSVQYV